MTKAHGTSEHKRQVVKITKFPTNQQGTTCWKGVLEHNHLYYIIILCDPHDNTMRPART
jgi:hypothetical protein